MKEVKLSEVDDEDHDARDEFNETCGFADWKASPESVLEEVDSLLKAHGLEVTIYDNDSDTVQFAIKPITA